MCPFEFRYIYCISPCIYRLQSRSYRMCFYYRVLVPRQIFHAPAAITSPSPRQFLYHSPNTNLIWQNNRYRCTVYSILDITIPPGTIRSNALYTGYWVRYQVENVRQRNLHEPGDALLSPKDQTFQAPHVLFSVSFWNVGRSSRAVSRMSKLWIGHETKNARQSPLHSTRSLDVFCCRIRCPCSFILSDPSFCLSSVFSFGC